MTPEIALLLAQDGISTGAIYVLVALGIVLIFLVTRVIFVPFGDVVGYSALTVAALQLRQMPGTVWLVLTLAAIATFANAHPDVLKAGFENAQKFVPNISVGGTDNGVGGLLSALFGQTLAKALPATSP